MKKSIIVSGILLLLISIVLTSCMSTTPIIETTVVTTVVQSVPTTVTVVKVVDPITGNEYTVKQGETGVANVDARATGYYDGYAAHWNGLVLNGMDTEQEFTVIVTPYINESYGITNSPANVANWVTVANPSLVDGVLTVESMSVRTLYITLNVPVGTQLPSEWGFTVNVVNVTNGGNYLVGAGIRWIVDMQQPS